MSVKNLRQLQEWMQDAIMNPTSMESVPKEILKSSKRLTSVKGLRIYNRAYNIKLVEILCKEYKVLAKTLGENLFNKFAVTYLEEYPSKSYTLVYLGKMFPQFLKETRPTKLNAPWSDFIIDLALLERTFFEVYDLPGCENKILPKPDQLLLGSRVTPSPCLKLLVFKNPVNRYFSKFMKGEKLVIEDKKETFLAVYRENYVVKFYEMSKQEFNILNNLVKGLTVKEALAGIANQLEFLNTIRKWISRGLFLEVNN